MRERGSLFVLGRSINLSKGGEEGLQKERMKLFISLTVVIISQVYIQMPKFLKLNVLSCTVYFL